MIIEDMLYTLTPEVPAGLILIQGGTVETARQIVAVETPRQIEAVDLPRQIEAVLRNVPRKKGEMNENN